MKKLFYLAMSFAAAAMTFVSCSKDDTTDVNAPVLSGETKTITLKTELAETRTTLGADHTISWAAGDQYGILLANSEGQIIGMTESSPYSGEGAFESELTVPKEAVYVCAYYPMSVVTASSEELRGKPISSIPVSVEADFDGTFAGVNYMAAKGEITENSTSLVFKPFVTVLEVLVYDSKGEGDDQLSMVTVSSEENICGEAVLDLSDDTATLSGWDENSINGYGNGQYIGTSADDTAAAYVAVAKGEYSFKVTVYTYEGMPYTKIYTTHNLEKDGYTVKIDLAADSSGIEAPTTDTEGGAVQEFRVLTSGYGYESDYPMVPQYAFTMKDTNSVTFENLPEYSYAEIYYYEYSYYQDGVIYENATFEDGVLEFNDEELISGEFKIFLYGEAETRANTEEPILIFCVAYATTPEGEGGGDDDDNPVFVLDKSSETTATLRLTTESDLWWSNEFPEAEQWTLIVNGSDDGVLFTNFPNVDPKPVVLGQHDYEYFELNPQGNKMSVFLLGEAYGSEDSAEYDVAFYDAEDVYVVLHVRYNIKDDEGGEGGGDEVLSGATSASGAGTVNLSTVSVSDMEKWNSSFPNVPQYYLQMSGTTSVKFENCPSNNIMAYDKSMEYDYADPDMGGVVSMKNNTFTIDFVKAGATSLDKFTFYVYFYGNDPLDILATMIVDWTKEDVTGGGDDGGDDGDDDDNDNGDDGVVSIVLDESSRSLATLRKATEEEDGSSLWYTKCMNSGYADDSEFWVLESTEDMISFTKFPYAEDVMIMNEAGTFSNEKGYFEVLYSVANGAASVSLLGEAYREDSAEYTIVFNHEQWGTPFFYLHVVVNISK